MSMKVLSDSRLRMKKRRMRTKRGITREATAAGVDVWSQYPREPSQRQAWEARVLLVWRGQECSTGLREECKPYRGS